MREGPRQLPSSPAAEGGFTIAEVMVALTLLLVGALALLVMIQGSLTSTSRTTAREQATNIARELIERSREVPFATTTKSAAPAALAAALPEAPAVSGTAFVVRRRNVDYAVNVSACSIDSPSDGAGLGDATFCDARSATTGPAVPATGSGFAIGPNVLGIPISVAVGGSLVNTICQAIGTDTEILNAVSDQVGSLTSLLGNGAQVEACPSSGDGSVAIDTRPDDLRRIRVKVQWTPADGSPTSLTQTTLLTTPG